MPTCTQQSISQLWNDDRKSAVTGSLCPPRTYVAPPAVNDSRTLLTKLHQGLLTAVQLLWSQILIGPTLCFSVWLWLVWKTACIPLSFFKWLFTLFQVFPNGNLKKRTVLISGGSTVQALHLARNFYSAGARVVMCEVEGCFDLTRFSTAVHRYYSIPQPDHAHVNNYINSLCDIVTREGVNYYIPVSATSPAIYDGLAKPHLELLNCVVFCPSSKEVRLLDDLYEVLDRSRHSGLPTPLYYPVTSPDDVYRLYDSGLLRTVRHTMTPVGCCGVNKRSVIPLPPFRQDFHLPGEISEGHPWVIVQQMKGERLVTCTTVKGGAVVGNIVCRRAGGSGLVSVERPEVARLVQQLLHSLKLRQMSGHLALELVQSGSGAIVVVGCRVGVPLSYICHTSVHPRLVWKPCRHFSRQSSGPIVAQAPRYWLGDAVVAAFKEPSVRALQTLVGRVLHEREALFCLWDPLPYCAFYHLMLPFQLIQTFLYGNRVRPKQNSHDDICVTCR